MHPGSTSGIGNLLKEGDELIQSLDHLFARAQIKQTMYKHLNLDDMKMLYNHFTGAYDLMNLEHPPNHPVPLSALKNKTSIIEYLTEDYGHDPLNLIDIYHSMTNPDSPGSPGTEVGSPSADDDVLLLKTE